jgi:transposase-like protein
VLAYMSFAAEHWSKIQSTNGAERLNGEIKRRTEVMVVISESIILIFKPRR